MARAFELCYSSASAVPTAAPSSVPSETSTVGTVTADVARGFVVLDGDASSFGTLDMYAARHQLAEQLGMSPAQLGIVLYSGSVILRLSLHAANSHPLLTQLVELHTRGVYSERVRRHQRIRIASERGIVRRSQKAPEGISPARGRLAQRG